MSSIKDFTAVIPAAGGSRRMQGKNKLLLDLNGKPVIARTLEIFQRNPAVSEIILVSSKDNFSVFSDIIKRYKIYKASRIVEGGADRYNSVYNGLLEVRTKYAAIHDGARPLTDDSLIGRVFDGAVGEAGCIPVLPVKDTVKMIGENGYVISTPRRDELFLVQTPQVFLTDLVKEAYRVVIGENISVTDDSQAMELMNHKIKTVPGSPENLKITTPEDIEVARLFLLSGKIEKNNGRSF